jgi:hypothetical protein
MTSILVPLFCSLPLQAQDKPMMTDLSADRSELNAAYNRADGYVRLILFLSPG